MRTNFETIVDRLDAITQAQAQAQAQVQIQTIALFEPEKDPLTYCRLTTHIDEVVRLLQDAGIERDSRIGLVAFNGSDLATAFLSIVSTAICAPLNPNLSENEFEFCFSDLQIDVLIVQSGSFSIPIHVAYRLGIPVLEMKTEQSSEAGIFTLTGDSVGKFSNERRFACADDIAIIMHTSGTTSRPKIVPLTHHNMCSSADSIAAVLKLSKSDCCLNVMPLFHIHGLVAALLAPLFAGGSIVCSPEFSPEKFLHWLKTFHVTWYTAVPAIHQEVLRQAIHNPALARKVNLRFIRSATSYLGPKLMSDLERVFNVPVIESYGMTEAAPQITSNPLPPNRRKPGSAGLAAGPEVAIVNKKGTVLDAGHSGEIIIRGPNIMKGYENDTNATSDVFINGWFRTGDEGYLDQDGYLFITGRIKEIINRGGKKIAPREIDEALIEHPDVIDAATFSLSHPTLGEDVVAAVVLNDGSTVYEQEIRRFVLENLSVHKVPTQILIVDCIPKGPTGKLQRQFLAQTFADRLSKSFIKPRNLLETIMVEIFQEVLEVEEIGINDNFFSLGGDSLLAMQVNSRILSRLNIELSPITLFRKPTIVEIAEILECMVSDELLHP
jgi:acyl-CoA synthetase (AMP-forming)/AMP-acid ligase II/acyl carrier protein